MPSETLYNFIREIGAITYGKERFFYEDGDMWYDRKSSDYITTQTAIEECLKAVWELDDGVLDAVPFIKCKDCVFWGIRIDTLKRGYCRKYDHTARGKDYCAWGEKK